MKGRDFVVLSDTLDGIPTSTFHLFKNIAGDNRVFWFNILTRIPGFSYFWIWEKPKRLFFSWLSPDRELSLVVNEGKGIRVISPTMVPLFDQFFRKINCDLITNKFRKLISEQKIVDPIIITTFPAVADFFQQFPSATRLYYLC